MTSTLAKLYKHDQTQFPKVPGYETDPYNPRATEPKYDEGTIDKNGWAVPYSSFVNWKVEPDLGELDDHSTMYREADTAKFLDGGAKEHGWTNPLGWRDDGHDDDTVLFQTQADGTIKERRYSQQ